ncbi:MAG TPA: sulfotransferase, partial [Rhodanobacteraceae bacterium]|nr:sulfotransferase [Rhodanobacteraceae bacterium]
SGQPDSAALQRAATTYTARARRDDAGDAYWFIDKQPLNFRYLDLLFAMFPGARVIHCQRDARDTALSLWTQCFLEDVQGYSYDFDDIALVMHDCARLMTHWRKRFPDSIRSVRYEDLASDPDHVLATLAAWIDLPAAITGGNAPSPETAISSASLWQARQPVHTRSVNRAERYLPFVPELARWGDA